MSEWILYMILGQSIYLVSMVTIMLFKKEKQEHE
jgi:hypothetical protein